VPPVPLIFSLPPFFQLIIISDTYYLNMQKITPFLWFDNQAEEAVNYYVSVFNNSKIVSTSRYDENAAKAAGRPKNSVMIMDFELDGQHFTALNGGPQFKFTPAISFFVDCNSQGEVDELWEKLSSGGEKGQCGWLQDKFGISWQIVPAALGRMMSDKDPQKSKRVTEAMLKMTKIDIQTLEDAYNNKSL
jgi:predicted 3-demethylubiquinone-9 3-methyltransferase (glyoxalase superfamily)